MAVDNTPIVAIVGRANVGKSSLFNRLTGRRQAIVDDRPGTTRDSVHGLVEWGAYNFWLVDTAGLKSAEDQFETSIQEQISEAATSADVIVVVIEAATMINNEDRQAAKLALKTGKPVILAINKIDTAKGGLADKFERLGIQPMISVSSNHGQGSGDLLDQIVGHLPKAKAPTGSDLTIALLGRPNVGKSSLLNSLAGKQQAIVSERAGTTRDIGQIELKYHDQTLHILDTAGLRRVGRIEPGVEKFSTLRTMGAIAAADVCVVIIDATEPSVAGDQHIAGLVDEAGKGLILVVNKWDALDKDDKTQARLAAKIQKDFQFAWWAPLIFTSAITGQNVTKLFELANDIHQRRQTKLPTPKLNTLLKSLTVKHPPAGLKNRQPKLNYVTQTGSEPPTFTFFCSQAAFLHFSYKRYLENGLREAFDFTGTPIKLEFKDKRGVGL